MISNAQFPIQNNNEDVIFQRLVPKSKSAAGYKMDSLEIDGMLETMRLESLSDPSYFREIFFAAVVIACRKTSVTNSLVMYNLTKNIVEMCVNKNHYEDGLAVALVRP